MSVELIINARVFMGFFQNNLWGEEMFFETEKPRLLYLKKHIDAEEVIPQQPREQVLYFYSTTATE